MRPEFPEKLIVRPGEWVPSSVIISFGNPMIQQLGMALREPTAGQTFLHPSAFPGVILVATRSPV